MEEKKQTVDISYEGILKIVLVLFALFSIFYLRDIIFIVFISVIIALIMNPAVDRMQKKKIPRVFGASFLFLATLIAIGLLFYFVVPPLAKELKQLTLQFPSYLNNINIDRSAISDESIFDYSNMSGPLQEVLIEVSKSLKNIGAGFISVVFGLLGGVLSAILILVISFYLIVEENGVEKFVKEIVPPNLQSRVLRIVEKIEVKLGKWFLGQMALGFIVGFFSFTGLYIIGVPYALVLGILAGVLELVPYIGPTISSIPAIIIAFTVSPFLAFLTLVLYFFIQQFENYLIVPKVMEKSVGLHPVIIIIVVLIGGQFAGIMGIILAVPVTAIISIVIKDFHENKIIESKK